MRNAAPGKPTIQQANAAASALIRAQAIEMTQNIYSNTITTPGSSANTINVIPRNVGLIKRFTVEITATLSNAGASAVTATVFNVANLLTQIVFNDLSNNTRIQTTGWHMNIINTIRKPKSGPFGSALVYATGHDVPVQYGSNYLTGSTTTGPGIFYLGSTTMASTSTAVVKMTYEIPLAYSDNDLRGAVYANVVNATMLLQLVLNPSPIVGAGDGTLAIFQGSGGTGSILAATVNVYQTFLDQLPVGKQGPILPIQDLSTIYELKNTALTGMVQNQDFPIPYANFRDFLSTTLIWDNGTANGQPAVVGVDIAYFALQSANFTNIFKVDPFLLSLWTRERISVDVPKSAYYFDHRKKPLSTIQYGNLELIMNIGGTVNAGAQALVGFEDFALVNTVSGAGSLAAG